MSLKEKKITISPTESVDENGETITTKNRDTGKTYQIQEMNVIALDAWANRCLSAMAHGGLSFSHIDISNGLDTSTTGGILQLAEIAVQGFGNIAPHLSQQLLDELINTTVSFVTESGSVRPLSIVSAGDVQEISTLWLLRKEAFNLHTGFFTNAST